MPTQKKGDLLHYASWNEWDAKKYLQTYFSKPGPDSFETWKFIIQELKNIKKLPSSILDFGSGPTLFAVIPIVPYTNEIHIADYLQSNLDEIKRWKMKNRNAFDWSNCIKCVTNLEKAFDESAAQQRENDLRKKITKLLQCDASLSNPIYNKRKYPLVLTMFCADSATDSKEIWARYMKNISSLVAPGGTIILAALRKCCYYKVGTASFPCANIDENDLLNVLIENNFIVSKIKIRIKKVPVCITEGFESILLASAVKSSSQKNNH